MFESYPDVLSVNNLKTALGIGRNKAYELVNNNVIKHIVIGKRILIPKCYLIEFVCKCDNEIDLTAS